MTKTDRITGFLRCPRRIGTAFLSGLLMLMNQAALADSTAHNTGDPIQARTHASEKLQHFRDCDVCSEMVVLRSGKYMMGATKEEFKGKVEFNNGDASLTIYPDEIPQHEVTVKAFALARFNVTRAQFAVFARETGFRGEGCRISDGFQTKLIGDADWQNPGFPQTDRDPVVCVSWDDAQKYIAWLNAKLNKPGKYRLPTEEEWEYAARAGTVTAAYWGDDPQEQCKYENARDLSARSLDPSAPYAPCTDGYVHTAPVGSFRPNPWGLFDMLGNARQWVENCSTIGYHQPPLTVETQPGECNRQIRGGAWASIPVKVRSAMRGGMKSSIRDNATGFRLAVDISNQTGE
jgi:formylglycine-generating enzyme